MLYVPTDVHTCRVMVFTVLSVRVGPGRRGALCMRVVGGASLISSALIVPGALEDKNGISQSLPHGTEERDKALSDLQIKQGTEISDNPL